MYVRNCLCVVTKEIRKQVAWPDGLNRQLFTLRMFPECVAALSVSVFAMLDYYNRKVRTQTTYKRDREN